MIIIAVIITMMMITVNNRIDKYINKQIYKKALALGKSLSFNNKTRKNHEEKGTRRPLAEMLYSSLAL